jgi:hypothetical protein
MPGVTTTVPNCLVVYICARDNDANGQVFSAQANASLTGVAERFDDGTNTGGGGGFMVATGTLTGTGASGTMTATVTSGINAWVVLALKPEPAASRVRITWVGFDAPDPVEKAFMRWDGSAWVKQNTSARAASAWNRQQLKRWDGTGWR